MADFQQNVVPTFTRLVDEDLGRMEKKILVAARRTPIGVIIPTLFNDLSSPAMQNIIQELAAMNFVKRIYISLETSSEEEFQRAREIIQPIKDRGMLLWNGAPAVQSVLEKINQAVPLGALGKGRAVWTALGYALGKSEVSVLAFHDADIVTYDRSLLLRLLYPVVHLRYQFAKGFYARYSDRLHGRVVRLFYFPFVKALRDIIGKIDFLEYMADFRYPLSGEFVTFASIAYDLLFPSDWGIEVGIRRNVSKHPTAPHLSGRDHEPLRPQTPGGRRRPKRRAAENGLGHRAHLFYAPGFRWIDPHAGFPAHAQAHLSRQRSQLRAHLRVLRRDEQFAEVRSASRTRAD